MSADVFDLVSPELLRHVLDALPVPVTVVHRSGRLLYTNLAAVAVTGWTVERELTAQDWTTAFDLCWIHARSEQIPLEYLPGARVLAGEAEASLPMWIRHMDTGSQSPVSLTVRPLPAAPGEPAGVQRIFSIFPVLEGWGEAKRSLAIAKDRTRRAQEALDRLEGGSNAE